MMKAMAEFEQWLNNERYNTNLYHDHEHDQLLDWIIMHFKAYKQKYEQ